MNPEDIPSDAIIEHEQGTVPEREIREPVAKYGSKKKKLEVQQPQPPPPPIPVTNLPPIPAITPVAPPITMTHHQTIDPHTAAMWAHAMCGAQRTQDMRSEHDQSSNSNY